MKLKIVILFVFFATIFLSLELAASYEVKFVYDGDTILLNSEDRVRYLGINTPEIDPRFGKNEFMANIAREFNFNLVNGALVRLEYDKQNAFWEGYSPYKRCRP